jgi:hypothetical protein
MFLVTLLAAADLAHSYICNYARINPGAPQAVHVAPSVAARRTDTLTAGISVYICDEAEGWYEIRFQARGHACQGSNNGLPVQRSASCVKAWVRKQKVKVISG